MAINRNEVIKINTDTGMIELSNSIVRNLAVGDNITDAEIYNFIQLCKYRKLNPFLGQAHIIKFKDKVQLITSKDVFIDRMNNHPKCEGWQSGIIVLNENGEVKEREGTFYLKENGEKLVGAWFKANIKGWKNQAVHTINLFDYFREYKNKYGKNVPMGQWGTMPAVMLEKCVTVAGIRKTFPAEFGGMYSEDELGIDKNAAIEATYEVKENDFLGDKKNEGKMKQLCIAAKSNKVDYKADDLLDYAMKQLYSNKLVPSMSKKDIPMSQFENVLKYVKELVKKKEESILTKEEGKIVNDKIAKKDESIKNKSSENNNEVKLNDNDLPIQDDNFAEPFEGIVNPNPSNEVEAEKENGKEEEDK